jgi:hypothetical protein
LILTDEELRVVAGLMMLGSRPVFVKQSLQSVQSIVGECYCRTDTAFAAGRKWAADTDGDTELLRDERKV